MGTGYLSYLQGAAGQLGLLKRIDSRPVQADIVTNDRLLALRREFDRLVADHMADIDRAMAVCDKLNARLLAIPVMDLTRWPTPDPANEM